MNFRYVITGGPGAGKTTILDALAKHGYSYAPESARNIIRRRMANGLSPRPAPAEFGREILDADIAQYPESIRETKPVFFDRGVLDALYILDSAGVLTAAEAKKFVDEYPYNELVLYLPPWASIYGTDSERDQTYAESVQVSGDMKNWYRRWGYEILEVPRVETSARVAFILDAVEHT